MRGAITEGEEVMRNPIRGTFAGCCASALAPHTVSATMTAKIPTHFGFWILRRGSVKVLDFRLSEQEFGRRSEIVSFMWFFSSIQNRKSKLVLNPSTWLRINSCEGSCVHLMILSALAKTLGGIVNPICLAVFKLMTSSNFVSRSTGKSAGLAPFKMRST